MFVFDADASEVSDVSAESSESGWGGSPRGEGVSSASVLSPQTQKCSERCLQVSELKYVVSRAWEGCLQQEQTCLPLGGSPSPIPKSSSECGAGPFKIWGLLRGFLTLFIY